MSIITSLPSFTQHLHRHYARLLIQNSSSNLLGILGSCSSCSSSLLSSSLPSSLSSSRWRHSNAKILRGQDPAELDSTPVYDFVGPKSAQKKHRNSVFVWGFAATGALGSETYMELGQSKDSTPPSGKRMMKRAPQRLRFVSPDTDVVDVAAGAGFTVLAATVRQTPHVLFGCGLNTDSQIGLQESANGKALICVGNVVPIRVPIDASTLNENQISAKGSPREKIVKVAAGRAHTICLTNQGKVYTLGNNSFGQCARPIIENEKYFANRRIHQVKVPIDSITRIPETVIDLVCGQDHTLLLTASGSVYACGWGADGQLGNGHFGSSGSFTKVAGDVEGEKIVRLSSAGDCVLAVNDKGQVFGWGNSEYGQLNMVTGETQVNVARHLNLERVVGKVSGVAAAGSMCALVNETGTVFVWGYGLLGLGPKVLETKNPTPLPEPLFGKSIFNPVVQVTSVSAGLHHFGAITSKGELYCWGKNTRANLGLGNEADMYFPYRVSVPGFVRKVSFGPDHTVALARNVI